MQQRGKNRWLSVGRERPHQGELLWTRGRQAGLLLAQEGNGVMTGCPVLEHAIASTSSLPGRRASTRESK